MSRNSDLESTSYAFDGDRGIRLAIDACCPRCGKQLRADEDVAADRCGPVALICSDCHYNILSVS